MPHLQQHGSQILIPFGGRSPRARRTSLQGARICRAGSQAARLLIAYLHDGPSTDLQIAERLGLPESRISARRNGLIVRGFVTYHDDVEGPHGAMNTRWTVNGAGHEVAHELARSH